MENAGDSSLEQGPNILNAVSVDIPGLHIGFLMIHGIMHKLRGIKPQVRRGTHQYEFQPQARHVCE